MIAAAEAVKLLHLSNIQSPLIIIGISIINLPIVWCLIFIISIAHIILSIIFYPYAGFEPMMLTPFLIVEIVVYINIIDRIKKSLIDRTLDGDE